MVLEPERRLSCTGMLSTTPPPPVLGWSSEMGAPPFTLQRMTRWPIEPRKRQMRSRKRKQTHLIVVLRQDESPFAM